MRYTNSPLVAHSVARLAIVNAPRGFTAIWNVMKPWIAKETAAKVSIMGSDYKSKLLEIIDPENLPAFLGGDRKSTRLNSSHSGESRMPSSA